MTPLPPPDALRARYDGWTWTVTSEWPDQVAWRVDGGGRPVYVKVVRAGHHPTALGEADRLRWARSYLPVPEVVDAGTGGGVEWLVCGALAGTDATRHPLAAAPARLVPALARGLAAFHAAAPVAGCPFDFTAAAAVEHARRRVAAGIATLDDLHHEHRHHSVEAALAELERLLPDDEDPVVCHGDYCFPNVLLDAGGSVTGYVDLGELGVADRWWDVAIGAWSVTWNVGPGWEDLFYRSYGVQPDPRRIAFYRLLYDLAS